MTENSSGKIGGLLLAAGGSSRLGRPKQLVRFQGKTLIRRAAETLVDSRCDPIIVVLGAEIDGSISEISGLPVNMYINKDWQTGMSSSIKAGLKGLLKLEPDLAAIMITLCDQPYISSSILDTYITLFLGNQPDVVAAEYEGTKGVPALFASSVFDELSKLEGDKGARELIHNNKRVFSINLKEGGVDIDTIDDLKKSLTTG